MNHEVASTSLSEFVRKAQEPVILSFSENERRSGSNLKEEINKLLWVWVPQSATMRECEELSCDIYTKIIAFWENRRDAAEA